LERKGFGQSFVVTLKKKKGLFKGLGNLGKIVLL